MSSLIHTSAAGFTCSCCTFHDTLSATQGADRSLEFNVGFLPGDSTDYVNAKDMLSLSLLQARLIDLKLPVKIVEGD